MMAGIGDVCRVYRNIIKDKLNVRKKDMKSEKGFLQYHFGQKHNLHIYYHPAHRLDYGGSHRAINN